MKIELASAGKRFNREWIFRKANLKFKSGTSYAITGPNGSGKSTLLQCIGGMLQLSEGAMRYLDAESLLPADEAYKKISFCAPYLDVIEEMSFMEFLKFHAQFKSFLPGLSIENIIAQSGLEAAAHKQIRFYSSGMKQRVKLAQAIFSDTPIVLLDEPCSNLDQKGVALYHAWIAAYCRERLVLVCSNDEIEYSFCQEVISIQSFKSSLPA